MYLAGILIERPKIHKYINLQTQKNIYIYIYMWLLSANKKQQIGIQIFHLPTGSHYKIHIIHQAIKRPGSLT